MPKSPEQRPNMETPDEIERQQFEELMTIFEDRDFEYYKPDEQTSFKDRGQEYKDARKADICNAQFIGIPFRAITNEIKHSRGEEAELHEQTALPSRKELEKVLKIFRDSPIIDIGTGVFEKGYRLAKVMGASGYIAIEPYFAKNLKNNLDNLDPDEKTIPYVVIGADALEALKHMKSGVANVITTGTDITILKNRKYNEELGREIERAIGDDGVFMKYDSVIENPNLDTVGKIIIENEFLHIKFQRRKKS